MEDGKSFKLFLLFVGSLIAFVLVVTLTHDYLLSSIRPEGSGYRFIEFFTMVLILMSIVYLAKEKVLNNETVAALLGAVGGYVLGK